MGFVYKLELPLSSMSKYTVFQLELSLSSMSKYTTFLWHGKVHWIRAVFVIHDQVKDLIEVWINVLFGHHHESWLIDGGTLGRTHWGREQPGWMLLSSAWLFVVVLSCCFALMFLEQFHCGVYVHHHLECIFCPRKNQKTWQGRMLSMYSGIRKGEFNANLLKCLWWWHYHPCSSVLLRFVISLVPD